MRATPEGGNGEPTRSPVFPTRTYIPATIDIDPLAPRLPVPHYEGMTKEPTMTKRITIKTYEDALDYLVSVNFDGRYLTEDADGNLIEEHRETCKRCGGAGYYPTPRHGACYECNGNPPNRLVRTGLVALAKRHRKLDLAAAARTRKAEAKNKAFNDKVDAAGIAFDAAYPGFRARLAPYLRFYNENLGYNVAQREHRILNDMADKLAKWGDMSEKAKAFAEKLLDDEDAPKAYLGEGKRVISGRIVSCKWVEGDYGSSYKITVDVDGEDCRIWGTLPSNIERAARDMWNAAWNPGDLEDVVKGASITFSSTIKRSDKSTDFGFYKRPTKAFAFFTWTPPKTPTLDPTVNCEHCDGYHRTEDCPAEAAHCERVEEAFR